jgi:hypothetical protein
MPRIFVFFYFCATENLATASSNPSLLTASPANERWFFFFVTGMHAGLFSVLGVLAPAVRS